MEELLVSQREFAKKINRSHVYVGLRVKDGSFPNVNGKIPLQRGIEAFKKYEKNKLLNQGRKSKKEPPVDVFAENANRDDLTVSEVLDLEKAFQKARLEKEQATAKIKEIEYRKLKGELVEVVEVEADARNAAAELRAFCQSAPTRYSALLENRTQREVEEELELIFRDLLRTLQSSKFSIE